MVSRLEDLGAMLRTWRLERDPGTVPGLSESRRRRVRVTQLDIGELLGVTERWYAALEHGEPHRYSRVMIERIVALLELSPHQAETLYWGTGHTPPRVPRESRTPDPAIVELMRQQPFPSYISDTSWDVVAANHLAATHLPWSVQSAANVMLWALSPSARGQLHQWRERWAEQLLGQLRASWQRWPADERLANVVAEVRMLPDVQELWHNSALAKTTPEADVRPVVFPLISRDPIDVRILAFSKFSDDALRWVIIVPADTAVHFQ